MLLHLFSCCLYNPAKKLFASYKNSQLKPSTIKSTLGREKDAEELKNLLTQYHKIIISGQFGTGKSHFIQYCLATWKLQDYCYIFYEINLKSTIKNIKYQNPNGIPYTNAYDSELFDGNFSSSLLVIDNMYFSKNFSEELEQLANMAVNVIIITVNEPPAKLSNAFYTYRLAPLHDDILHKIFEHDSGLSLPYRFLEKQLYETSLRNVLMVSLIACQCKKLAAQSSSQENGSQIVEKVLTRLGYLDSHMNLDTRTDTKFKHPYDVSTAF